MSGRLGVGAEVMGDRLWVMVERCDTRYPKRSDWTADRGITRKGQNIRAIGETRAPLA